MAQQDVGVRQGLVGALRQGVDGVKGVEEFSGEGGGVGRGVEGEEEAGCGGVAVVRGGVVVVVEGEGEGEVGGGWGVGDWG